jgi:hypothetical protein
MSVINESRVWTERHKKPSPTIITIKDVTGGGLVQNLDDMRLLQLIFVESEAIANDQVELLFQVDGRQEDLRVLRSARGEIEHDLYAAVSNKPFVSLTDDDRLLLFRCVELTSAKVSQPFLSPTRDRKHAVCRLDVRWKDGSEFDYDILADRAGEVIADFEAGLKRIQDVLRDPLSLA